MDRDLSAIAANNKPISLKVVTLSGRSGSGKSSTAYEMCHLLRSHRIMHVHIDGDNLNTLYPDDESCGLAMQNLEAVWTRYWLAVARRMIEPTQAGVRDRILVVVISGTAMVLKAPTIEMILKSGINNTHEQTQLQMEQLDVSMHLVLLETHDEVIRQRLQRREIGGELEAHLKSSDKMADVLTTWRTKQDVDTFAVNSSVRDVHNIAVDILGRCGIKWE